jgi:hypothetical protein
LAMTASSTSGEASTRAEVKTLAPAIHRMDQTRRGMAMLLQDRERTNE